MTYIGAFDMGLAQTDGKYAFEAWKNCKYAGNTVGILPEELKALEDQYKACLVKWEQWAEETCFVYPGAIQFYGPSEVCDITTVTLALEQAK